MDWVGWLNLVKEPVAKSLGHCLRLGVNLQFLVDLLDVKTDGVESHAQFCGGSFVVVSFDQ